MSQDRVLVCHASSCLRRGAEGVLAEIEELGNVVGGCSVAETGCLGYCSQAPNVIVLRRGKPARVHTRVDSLEASAGVVAGATGRAPDLEDAAAARKISGLRAARARQRAREVFHWNAAMSGLAAAALADPRLQDELDDLRAAAGCAEGATGMPAAVAEYTRWTLESVAPRSKHAAVYTFSSTDRKRGTPHPRGRGRQVRPVTWHATLLAEVGPNGEGPLPWVERDYTPVSTAHEWEQGTCELLVKIYGDGAATSWLRRRRPGDAVFLSRPVTTLSVPGLVPPGASRAFRPASVLLLVAGTGAVALPQILAHRDPANKLRIATPRRDRLLVPLDVLLSCREDDVPLAADVAGWCREAAAGGAAAGVRDCALLLTPAAAADGGAPPPFPDGPAFDGDASFAGAANARVLRSRLTPDILAVAYANMPRPCRVVVSGPGGYNAAAFAMLADIVDDVESITVLAA